MFAVILTNIRVARGLATAFDQSRSFLADDQEVKVSGAEDDLLDKICLIWDCLG